MTGLHFQISSNSRGPLGLLLDYRGVHRIPWNTKAVSSKVMEYNKYSYFIVKSEYSRLVIFKMYMIMICVKKEILELMPIIVFETNIFYTKIYMNKYLCYNLQCEK